MNNIKGKAYTISFTTSAVTVNTAGPLLLPDGWYNLTADQDCYVESGSQGDAASCAGPSANRSSFPVWAKGYGTDIYITGGYVGVKGISASGTLWLKPGVR